MIIVKLQGGLGNQMFQYAAGKSLALQQNCNLFLDISTLMETSSVKQDGFTPREYELGIFNLKEGIASDIMLESFFPQSIKNKISKKLGLGYRKKYTESSLVYDNLFFKQKSPLLLCGYWQSEKYFSNKSAIIRTDFQFPTIDSSDPNYILLEQIQESISVSIHVRHGDFIQDKVTNAFHGICSPKYYEDAIDYMRRRLKNITFFFFSDNTLLNETFISEIPNSIWVRNNEGKASWKDMYLMSKCNHHIIANSSFSWWGAWLNPSPDKIVIAPNKWFSNEALNFKTKHLVPESWIRL